MFQNPTGDLRASLSYSIFWVLWEVGARKQERSACTGPGVSTCLPLLSFRVKEPRGAGNSEL